MNDAGSLQNLNDIVSPGPAAWWPFAPGWYLLLAVLSTVLAVLAVRGWLRWRRNRYRRQAIALLSSIREEDTAEGLRELPALLKRAALSVWPREEVAALTGSAWHGFLDTSTGMKAFSSGAGETLKQLAYAADNSPLPPDAELQQVFEAAEHWLKHHRRGVD